MASEPTIPTAATGSTTTWPAFNGRQSNDVLAHLHLPFAAERVQWASGSCSRRQGAEADRCHDRHAWIYGRDSGGQLSGGPVPGQRRQGGRIDDDVGSGQHRRAVLRDLDHPTRRQRAHQRGESELTTLLDPHAEAAERKLATVLFADLVASTAPRRPGGSGAHVSPAGVLLRHGRRDRSRRWTGREVRRRCGRWPSSAFPRRTGPRGAGSARRARDAASAGGRALRRQSSRFDRGEDRRGRHRPGAGRHSFVTGDAVNVAARLEQAAEPGEIVVGARTAEAVRGAFELDDSFDVDAKGKSEPVVAHRLFRALTLMRPRGVRGGARAFVGRDTEPDLLQRDLPARRRPGRAAPRHAAG